jgi:hypothetical protein
MVLDHLAPSIVIESAPWRRMAKTIRRCGCARRSGLGSVRPLAQKLAVPTRGWREVPQIICG